jgi:hypothetical protein
MTRFLLLAVLLFSGCGLGLKPIPVDPTPEPEPDVVVSGPVDAAAVGDCYRALMLMHAKIHRECAARIRAGAIASPQDESAFNDPLMVKARQEAMKPITAIEEAAIGGTKWTPEKAAPFRDALADALEAGL